MYYLTEKRSELKVNSLKLKNFRNYDLLNVEFDGSTNIFYGNNAQGKTNILEAVYLCGTTKSHKGSKDREMIRFGEEEALIRMAISRSQSAYEIDMHLKKNRPKGIAVNGVPIRKAAELLGIANFVFFSPEDLGIIKNGPAERRRFIDMELCQLDKLYLHELSNYNKVIIQRNKLLKECSFNSQYEEMLDIWDMQLDDVSFGEYVDDTVLDMSVRLMIVNMLAADKRIELGTAELSDSMESADAFYDEHEPELTYVSRDEVETLFEMMRLSDKVYNELGKNVDTEISMDEARVIRIQYIYSKDSMQKLYDAVAEYEEGAAFSSLAAKYSDIAEYTAEIGRGEMDKNFENTAFNLDEGQISSVISCNNGFYLIYCVNDNVEDKIDSQKERIVQNRQKEQFENFFNEFSKNVVLSFDKNAWDRITAQLKQGEQ